MTDAKTLSVRGYLLHLTHYDPGWCPRKAEEQAFDLEVALDIVGALADEGFNLLAIDVADAVEYRSHPELKRHYTVPMEHLETLAAAAREGGLEVVPKLNFSRSYWHKHNDWMLGPDEDWRQHFDDDAYWEKAFGLIDELIGACHPERFFHIGMDEDHDRSHPQYTQAIERLHAGLADRGLRAAMWNDSACLPACAQVHFEKALAAEDEIPRDVVQVLWDYETTRDDHIQRICERGFELWGAPGGNPTRAAAIRDAVLRHGGQGLFMTSWARCDRSTSTRLLESIHRMGPIYRCEA